MRGTRIPVALAACLAMMFAHVGPAHAEQVGRYVGSAEGFARVISCETGEAVQSSTGVGVGAWCFSGLPAGGITIELRDVSGLPVGGIWATNDVFPYGVAGVDWWWICGATVVDHFPGGDLLVIPYAQNATYPCLILEDMVVGPALAGEIAVM